MNNSKLFKDMTPEEQNRYFLDFSNYSAEKLPLLCQMGDAWTDARIKCFEDGLALLQAFSYCRDFVEKTLYWRDFSRRVNRLLYLMDKVRKEISEGRSMKTESGKTIVAVPDERKSSRRGRPRKQPEPAASVSSSDISVAASAIPPASQSGNVLQQIASQAAGVERIPLKNIAWLLSAEMQDQVKRVKFLRATVTAESEQAKALAENNVPSQLIEPHTKATIEAMDIIQRIYDAVDNELAEVYYRLSQDNDFGGYKAVWEKQGGVFSALLEMLYPYFEKKGGEAFAATLKSNDVLKAEQEEVAKATAARTQKIHAARTYIMRTDLVLTADRLSKMKDYLQECKDLEYEKVSELEEVVNAADKKLEEEIANRPDLFRALDHTVDSKDPIMPEKPAAKTGKKK